MVPVVKVVKQRIRVAVIIGTRPEAIKMAPIVHALRRRPHLFQACVIVTAQHRELLDQVMKVFGFTADIDLDVMRSDQSLASLSAIVLERIDGALESERPDLVLVQGDTTTAFMASFAAFLRNIPVGHIEAGLRSHDMRNPFPEEANRRLASIVSDIHFAPTPLARYNLLREGITADRVTVTGNPVVDALQRLAAQPQDPAPVCPGLPMTSDRILLVTSHRRESWGQDLENTCTALRELVARFADIAVVYPVHPNPNVRQTVTARLSGHERIHLLEPVDYLTFLQLLRSSYLILTDSGGVQEEAPSFGKPVLVLRRTTERPEAASAGLAKIIGTSPTRIVEEAAHLLTDSGTYAAMASGPNPFGDGRAAERIVEAIERWARKCSPLLPPHAEFQCEAPLLAGDTSSPSFGE